MPKNSCVNNARLNLGPGTSYMVLVIATGVKQEHCMQYQCLSVRGHHFT